MLRDRQQLDVREAGLGAGTAPAPRRARGSDEEAAVGVAPPRAEVHLVDRDRRVERVARAPARHPVGVAPLVVERPDARRGAWRLLAEEGERIALVRHRRAVARHDAVLVGLAVARRGREPLPDAGAVPARRSGSALGVPAVPVADHRHRARVRRPDRELRARPRGVAMAAEVLVQARVRALAEQVDVVVAQHRNSRSSLRDSEADIVACRPPGRPALLSLPAAERPRGPVRDRARPSTAR